jgi:hypothetical protein
MAFSYRVRIRLPTYLYIGMPPRRAAPGSQHARAEHGVALAGHEWVDQSVDHLGGVLAVAVQQHHDVEPVLDGPAVARLLVAAVAEVDRVADHGERQVETLCGSIGAVSSTGTAAGVP